MPPRFIPEKHTCTPWHRPFGARTGVHAGTHLPRAQVPWSVGTVVVVLSIYKEESKVNRPLVTAGYTISFEMAQGAVSGDGFCNRPRRYASISITIPPSTRNHLIFGSDSLNQLACLRTKIRVTRLISTFACSALNSPLMTLMHSRYPIAEIVGREGRIARCQQAFHFLQESIFKHGIDALIDTFI